MAQKQNCCMNIEWSPAAINKRTNKRTNCALRLKKVRKTKTKNRFVCMTKQKKKKHATETTRARWKGKQRRKNGQCKKTTTIRITPKKMWNERKKKKRLLTNDQRTAVGCVNFSANAAFNRTWFCCFSFFIS